MLSMYDRRWDNLLGGRRECYDPRPALMKLQSGSDVSLVWEEFWDKLHHQGDVDEASYASVPHLVRIYRENPSQDWNIYAIASTIELARTSRNNPALPSWVEKSYSQAIQELAELGLTELTRTSNREMVRAILSVLALARGARVYARFLLEYSEDELLELEGTS